MRSPAILIACLLCLLPPAGMQAQEYTQPPVTVSREKVRGSDGKVYYSHVVLERQTLFSIGKAYGVSAEEIEAANPGLDLQKEGLRKNSILLIPVKASDDARTPDDAPAARQDPSAAAPQSDKDDFTTHTVRWYEDIDDIARKYGITVDLIMQVNDLPSRKLKNRQKLLIPKDPARYAAAQDPKEATGDEEGAPDEGLSDTDGDEEDGPEEEAAGRRRRLLPFSFGRKSQVDAILLLPMKSSTSMDFYSGFLMAVKELGEKGTGISLSVHDVSGGTIPVSASRLAEADVVFGPIAPADLAKVLDLADGGTVVVSPLDQKAAALVPSHRNLVQAPASPTAQYEDIIRWIREEKTGEDKVVVVSEQNGQESELYSMVRQSGLEFTPFSYNILQGRNIVSSLGGTLSQTGVNRIVIDSESEAFVNDVVRNLSLLIHGKYEVVVYSASKIRSFDTIDVENLHNVSLHVSLSYFIDYENPAVKKFLPAYRALFGTEPNQFAFQGYDLAAYFLQACADYGDAWIDRLENLDRSNLFQADFKFREAGDGGLVNHGIRRVVYNPDYTVRLCR